MKFFDDTLKSIYNLFTRFINFLKIITSVEIIRKLEKFAATIHNTALVISSVMILIIGLIMHTKTSIGWMLPLSIFGPIMILFISYLSNDFHKACSDLITSNTTSLSNDAILRLGGIISLVISIILFLGAFASIFNGDLKKVVYLLLFSFLLFMSAGTQFNPSLLNIEITKKSTSGEDFIAIFSLYLKSTVFFEKIISTILIVLGNIYLIANLISQELGYFMSGISFMLAGIAYPIIIYMIFTILWFFNSLFLGILSLARKK